MMRIVFSYDFDMRAFLGRRDACYFHRKLYRLPVIFLRYINNQIKYSNTYVYTYGSNVIYVRCYECHCYCLKLNYDVTE